MERLQPVSWQTVERPGYLGKKKDEKFRLWDREFGKGNWRIVNQLVTGEIYSYEDIIYKVYMPGYEAYFLSHPDDLKFITQNFSYAYDKDQIDKDKAFDIYALYNKPGVANQFHHVAFNVAIEQRLGVSFKGSKPLKVREGKPGTPDSQQPDGYKWSPGRIPCTIAQLIPDPHIFGWWGYNSIEDFYQSTKTLQKNER